MMTKTSLGFVLLGLVVSVSAGPGSCSGRCGEKFTRGKQCKCDFNCLQHNECCQDFESICTTGQSCQGRCGEAFKRGQLCECDPLCSLYSTCCHDHQLYCDASGSASKPNTVQPLRAAATGSRKLDRGRKRSNSESEEWYPGNRRCSQHPGGRCPSASGLKPLTDSSSRLVSPAVQTNSPHAPGAFLGSSVPVSPSGSGRVNIHLVLSPNVPEVISPGLNTGAGVNTPAVASGSRPRPSTLQDVAQALGLSMFEGGFPAPAAGAPADANLCSNSPINGLTALRNGTVLIFKGEVFWSVDPVSRSVGRPQSITDTLGVASPIDTVFTRQNCLRNTYIIKGDQYWRLDENLVLEPGYPKPLTAEFPGLTGGVSAALAVPATGSRPETIFFFRNGDVMQRFTFPPDSIPSCTNKPESFSMQHAARQAEVLLSGDINIKVALKGFPTPVTSALTVENPHAGAQYEHYIFSGPLFFSITISGDLPALAPPAPSGVFAPQVAVGPAVAEAIDHAIVAVQNPPHPANSLIVWLRCP